MKVAPDHCFSEPAKSSAGFFRRRTAEEELRRFSRTHLNKSAKRGSFVDYALDVAHYQLIFRTMKCRWTSPRSHLVSLCKFVIH